MTTYIHTVLKSNNILWVSPKIRVAIFSKQWHKIVSLIHKGMVCSAMINNFLLMVHCTYFKLGQLCPTRKTL